VTLLVFLLVGATACGTSYRPRPGPRIVRITGEYQRDGRTFHVGPLGGGADELVAGNPRALEHVRREQSLARRGMLVYGLGLASIIFGSIAAAAVAPDRAKAPAAFGAIGLGAGLSTLGIYWGIESNAALLDAINVYNDDLEAARAAAPGGAP
jgi:hypothetical protein